MSHVHRVVSGVDGDLFLFCSCGQVDKLDGDYSVELERICELAANHILASA